jgi:hypothetical protein
MRRARRLSCLAAICSAALLDTAAQAAPTSDSPRSARIGGPAIHVAVRGLRADGRYALTLVANPSPTRLTVCVARLATEARRTTRVKFTARIPRRLHCYENDAVSLGPVATRPGAYHLIVAVADGPSGFAPASSFVRIPIKLTP